MLGQYEMKSDPGHPGGISLATGGHFCMRTHSNAILNLASFTISPKHICSSSLYLSFPGAFLLHEGSNSDRAEKEGELFYLRQASIVPVRCPSCTQRLPHFPLKKKKKKTGFAFLAQHLTCCRGDLSLGVTRVPPNFLGSLLPEPGSVQLAASPQKAPFILAFS